MKNQTAPLPRLLSSFKDLFSVRVWDHVVTLVYGAILARGPRTVVSALRAIGYGGSSCLKFHRVLSHRKWCSWVIARRLLGMLVEQLTPRGPVIIGIDDTIERRRGRKISALGVYRDPVRSTRSHFVKTTGLRWVSAMLIAHVPFARRHWALPFLTVLAPSENYHKKHNRRHVTTIDHAVRMVRIVRKWLKNRSIVFVVDGAYAAFKLLNLQTEQVTFVTRLPITAALYKLPPRRKKHAPGRPRIKGDRLPSARQPLADNTTCWQRTTVSWYGSQRCRVKLCSGISIWYSKDGEYAKVRWVLINRTGKEPVLLASTDTTMSPHRIVSLYVQRWNLEVTYHEARAHLGIETQRQWLKTSIARTTPTLFGLFSLIALAVADVSPTTVSILPFYEKSIPTFSDAIAAVRLKIWTEQFFTFRKNDKVVKIPRRAKEQLSSIFAMAG
jgi:hypothetical protein